MKPIIQGLPGIAATLLISALIYLLLPQDPRLANSLKTSVLVPTRPRVQPLLPENRAPQALRSTTQKSGKPLAAIRFGTLTRQHMAQYDQWIANAPGSHYFLQLLTTDARNTGTIEGFLSRATEALPKEEIRAYRSNLSGSDRVGVIFGDYPDRASAAEAMRELPDEIQAAQPFPRQVTKLY